MLLGIESKEGVSRGRHDEGGHDDEHDLGRDTLDSEANNKGGQDEGDHHDVDILVDERDLGGDTRDFRNNKEDL